MAGIYVHIPFCKQACHYCNFHFSTSLGLMEPLIAAILKEIELQSNYLQGATVETLYFGGGTPSILSTADIAQLIETIYKVYPLASQLELTLEANPDDLTKDKLKELASIGINRLSIGVQSFHDIDLKWMNRSHNADEAFGCIQDAQSVGITDLSIDLIFGSQTTTMAMWEDNLKKATALELPHLSCYGLTVEEGTALAHYIHTGKMNSLDNNLGAEQFEITQQLLTNNKYEHYEISNYAKDNRYSRHNTNYWRQVPYLGLGPAAHSYDGIDRQWNIANNKKYITALTEGALPYTKEKLSKADRYNEYVMTGLRTMWGCDLSQFDLLFPNWKSKNGVELDRLLAEGHITKKDESIVLSKKGKLIADQIMSQLFITE